MHLHHNKDKIKDGFLHKFLYHQIPTHLMHYYQVNPTTTVSCKQAFSKLNEGNLQKSTMILSR